MAETRQTFSTEIDATPEECFAAIVDFAAYPDWSSAISACNVREYDENGRARVVEFELDMRIKMIRYVLAYRAEPPHKLEWSLVEGDLAGVEGSYHFEASGPRTNAICSQAVDLGFWIPGPIRRVFEQKALQDSVLEFKVEVERRSRG